MAFGRKSDAMPLLGPGRHHLSLSEIFEQFVRGRRNEAHRERLFLSLEEFVQKLLVAKIPCELRIDGSFLTEKEMPSDVDVIILVESDINAQLSEAQDEILYNINLGQVPTGVDAAVYTIYNSGHKDFGTSLDVGREWAQDYGLENSGFWLKGYVVLRLWQADVGLRVCS